MNVEDINGENYSNILHAELKLNLDIDYIGDCELKAKGWFEKDNCFTIEAICLSTGDLIDAYHYGSKREYESDLKTINKK
tara:strand:+ start:258 stop:497 length:240 start_codon:yes stop_codon:yes gene_type:complete